MRSAAHSSLGCNFFLRLARRILAAFMVVIDEMRWRMADQSARSASVKDAAQPGPSRQKRLFALFKPIRIVAETMVHAVVMSEPGRHSRGFQRLGVAFAFVT
jgi:hypothetical protein